MRRLIYCMASVILASNTLVGWAQNTETPPTPEATTNANQPVASAAAEALSALLKSADEALKQRPAYRVLVDARWSVSKNGQVERAGQNHLSFLASGTNRLRIEGRDAIDQPVQLLLVSDGSSLTKAHTSTRQFSIEATTNSRASLAQCDLAHSLFQMCGVQILLSPHPQTTVFSQLVQLVDLGVDHDHRHFRLGLQDGREVEVWFSNAAPHLPAKLVLREAHSLNKDWKQELQIATDFNWELDVAVNDQDFQFVVPEGWKQVRSLSQTLAEFGVEDVLARPLPNLQLTDVSGKSLALDQETRPVLLYFWATWAAPSSELLPEMVEFSRQLEGQGIKVVAVNVGEARELVTEFLKLNKIDASVALDREGAGIHALHLSELPAVVLIGKDHSIQAVHQAADKSIRPLLVQQLEKLLKGESLHR